MDWRDEELTSELEMEPAVALGDVLDESLASIAAENDSPSLGEWAALAPTSEVEDKADTTGPSRENGLLGLALVISLIVHVSLLALALNARFAIEPNLTPDFVEIQLIPSNPLLVEETAPEIVEEPVEAPETVEELVEEISTEIAEVAEIEPLETNEPLPAEEQIEVPEVFVPSIVSVRDTIDAIEADATSRLWAYDCDAIEEESDLRTCNPTDRRNYEVVERNTTYEALNPVRELSRGVRTLGTVTTNSPELAARLLSSDLPDGLSVYVMEQVEAGITHNTNSGNRVLENMDIMTENEVEAQIRYIMNDPWVKNQEKVLRQRNVHAQ
ncbi:MAG: hypothetical protein GKR91_00090 [Pseudomonadales bacterium]|nr:hypothetical protein [Pseudomonadales bacterium]